MSLGTENKILKPEYRCRICLEATNGKVALNQTIDYKKAEISLTELLEFCLNVQVCENGKADGLCLACMEKGIVSYEFKKKFEESQSILLREIEESNRFVIKTEVDLKEEDLGGITENGIIKEEILIDVLVVATENGELQEEILVDDVLVVETENGVSQEEILDDDVLVVETENGVLQEEILDDDVLVVETENGVLQEEILDDDVLVVETENGVLQEEILDDDVLVVETENGALPEEISDEEVLTENYETFEAFFLRHLGKEEILGEKSQIAENIKRPENGYNHLDLLKCDICGETCTSRSSLMRHDRKHHSPRRQDTLKCRICDKAYRLRLSLMNHVRMAHKISTKKFNLIHKKVPSTKKFMCEICMQ